MVRVFAQRGRDRHAWNFSPSCGRTVPARAGGGRLRARAPRRGHGAPGRAVRAAGRRHSRCEPLDAARHGLLLEAFLSGRPAAFGQEAGDPGARRGRAVGRRPAAGHDHGGGRPAIGGEPVAGASLIARRRRWPSWQGSGPGPHWRRQGLLARCCRHAAGALLAEAASSPGCRRPTKPSAALYRGLGFSPCGTQLNYAGPAARLDLTSGGGQYPAHVVICVDRLAATLNKQLKGRGPS